MWKSFLTIAAVMVSVVVVIRERYRVLNTILAVHFLRQAIIRLSMGIAPLRERILPILFKRSV